MRILILASLLLGLQARATQDKLEPCQQEARSYVEVLENKILGEIGVIQGYEEAWSISTNVGDNSPDDYSDFNFDVKYDFEITANNDEGDWWVSKYKVKINAHGSQLGKYSCRVLKLDYLGVTEQGSPEDNNY